jgi:radical SAM protein with 4Fe4S-binding SPASM domain
MSPYRTISRANPKPCMGGWGRRSLNVSPSGKVLPCHAAETIPGLEFWSVRDHSLADIWHCSPSFNAFRGTDWMKEPCASCPRRLEDFGGCRCQALALTGDAREADPVCHLSPHHGFVAKLAERATTAHSSTGASGLIAPLRLKWREWTDGQRLRCPRQRLRHQSSTDLSPASALNDRLAGSLTGPA